MLFYTGFRSTSSAKELDSTDYTPQLPDIYLDPQAPRKSLTGDVGKGLDVLIFRSTSSAKELDTYASIKYAISDNLDPQAPRKSLTARFVINHSKCNKKYYLHLIIYRTFIVNCYILF